MDNIIIDILNETNTGISGYEEVIRHAAMITLQHESFKYRAEISIIITDNKKIRELNKKYRKMDRETDVLSFPCCKLIPGEYTFDKSFEPVVLGDIVISLDKAKEQAEEYGHSVIRELSFLVCHSVLHLLGYEHADESEQNIMMEKQRLILDSAGITR